jgi:hypothetical protein
LFATCGSLLAQTAGNLGGQVLDPAQGAISGATVTAEHTVNGQKRQVTTDASGRYAIANLSIGTYRVTAEHVGFQAQVFPSVQIGVAQSLTLDFALPVAGVSQSVEVSGQAALLDTEQTTGSNFNAQSLVELPIDGRDYTRFSLLTPGAVASSNWMAALSFNGQQTIHNQYQIDGVDATRVDFPYMANGIERGARLLTGSLETVEEFRAQTSSYPPEFGRAAGTYINIATKSGVNQLHGSLWEFFRNSAFDARNFFNTTPSPQAEFRYSDFGANVNGAIKKDKTFYFINYEGSRQRVGITGSGTVPSALLRSQVVSTSPVLAPLVALFPIGTSSTSNSQVDNYTTTSVNDVREDTGSIKLDHYFSTSNTAFFRVNTNDSHVTGPDFGVTPAALGVLDFESVPIRTSNVAIHDQHVFSPHLVDEFLAGVQRWGQKVISDEPYPLLSITGLTASPGTHGRSRYVNTSYQISDSLSYISGAHSFKAGFQAYRVEVDRRSIATQSLTYTSISDFIKNSVYSASQSALDPGYSTRGYLAAAYAQDSWRIRSGLTFDYGLRLDVGPPPFDPYGNQRTFSLALLNLAPAGTKLFATNWDFAPRLGIAWQPDKKLMVRTGYGLFYQTCPVGIGAGIPTNTLPGNTSLSRSLIPTLQYPLDPFLAQGTLALPSVTGFDPNRRDLYAQQWNVTTEYALAESTSVSLAYVANHGVRLRRNENINWVNPATNARPISGFSTVTYEMNNGQNIYDGLQASLKQRFKSGIELGLSYAWGHGIDDVQDYDFTSMYPQNNNNLKAERGNAQNDMRQSVSYQVIYDLPFGRDKRYLKGATAMPGWLISGWEISSIGRIRTGIPETIFIGVNTYGNGDTTNQRPNAVAGVSQYAQNKSITNWFNSSAFSMPATGTFGDLGRNTVFGPGFSQQDLSLIKNQRIRERSTLQFRAEIFNVFNHPTFALPSSTFNVTGFGQVLSTFGTYLGYGVARDIQLAIKLRF